MNPEEEIESEETIEEPESSGDPVEEIETETDPVEVPEENSGVDPIEELPVDPLPVEDPQPIEMVVPEDSEMMVALQQLNDTMAWSFAVQFIIIGLLFFILIFTSIQAGKN